MYFINLLYVHYFFSHPLFLRIILFFYNAHKAKAMSEILNVIFLHYTYFLSFKGFFFKV